MKIEIVTESLPPQFAWDPTCPVRGTEKFYAQTASVSQLLGHDVTVIYDGPEKVINRVRYLPRSRAGGRVDLRILCNPRPGLTTPWSGAESTVIWTNLHLGHHNNYVKWYESVRDQSRLPSDTTVVAISQYARKLMSKIDNVVVIPHGYDERVYFDDRKTPRTKTVAYTSSPDRGLDYLRQIWDDYDLEATTGYGLWVSDYGSPATTDRMIADKLRSSAFWVHPGRGVELFCLAAVEAQACGATPIVVPNGALAETVHYGYRFTPESFAEGLCAVLSGDAVMKEVDAFHIAGWFDVTEKLLAVR